MDTRQCELTRSSAGPAPSECRLPSSKDVAADAADRPNNRGIKIKKTHMPCRLERQHGVAEDLSALGPKTRAYPPKDEHCDGRAFAESDDFTACRGGSHWVARNRSRPLASA
jgi:hypothetical protein